MLYLVIIAGVAAVCYGGAGASSAPTHAPNELLVRFSPSGAKTTPSAGAELDRLNRRFGLESEMPVVPFNSLPGNAKDAGGRALARWRLLRFPPGVNVANLALQYETLRAVEQAQPNYLRQFAASPNDSLFRQQWNLSHIGWTDVESADASHLIVAVIDSGLDYLHPDIAGQVWANEREVAGESDIDDDANGYVDDLIGWDFTHAPGFAAQGDYLDRDGDPMDESGHGTHVAGIIAATSGNGIGIAGVAKGVRIMPLRAGFNLPAGGFLEDDDLAAAIVYAADNGADILNMSWGDPQFSPLIRDVIRYARSRGCVLVAAAGNDGSEAVFYPAKLDETIAVGASGPGDVVPAFTNSGPSLDIAAPGIGIWSLAPGGSYVERTGTSMAAAHISGIAAALLAQGAGVDAAQVRASLALGARDIGLSGWDDRTGAGVARIDVLTTSPPVVAIAHPAVDDLVVDRVAIALSVNGDVGRLDLSWRALGEDSAWTSLFAGTATQATSESLVWDVTTLAEGRYELRLRELQHGLQDRVEVRVQRTPPRIVKVALTAVLDGPNWDHLLEWETDESSGGEVSIVATGGGDLVKTLPVSSLARSHSLTLGADLDPGEYRVILGPRSGHLRSAETVVGDFTVTSRQFPQWNSVLRGRVEDGYLMPIFTDFNGNGLAELVQMPSSGTQQYGEAVFHEPGAAEFGEVFRCSRLFIPWNTHDLDDDGLSELMAVDAQRVRLLEPESEGRFPQRVVWEQRQVWGGETGDLDGDGAKEMFLRSSNADLIHVFENQGDDDYSEIALLFNPTTGTNELGDRQLVGDFDDDGREELLVGDGDGDLYIFESFANDSYRRSWLLDGDGEIDGRVIGGGTDLDGDSRIEFVVAHLLLNRVRPDRQRWRVSVFQAVGDNEFAREWSVDIKGGSSAGNGIVSGDLNGDGLPELVLALVPDLYVFGATDVDSYEPLWHTTITNSRRPAIGDLTTSGDLAIAYNATDGVEIRSMISASNVLLAPAALRGHSTADGQIAIFWDPIEGAVVYRVFRDGILLQGDLTEPEHRDESVETGRSYEYSVAAVDERGIEGERSHELKVKARLLAQVLRVERVSPTQLAVEFGEPMQPFEAHLFHLDPGVGKPTSVVQDRDDSRAVLGFESVLPDSGRFELVMVGVRAVDGTPLDPSGTRVAVELKPYLASVQVVEAVVVTPLRIELQFDGAVRYDGDDSTFSFAGDIRIRTVEILEEDRLRIDLDDSTPMRTRGETVQLIISGLPDVNGNLINERVALRAAATDLGSVTVFPNPFVPERGPLVFANLTESATIHIYNLVGQLVRTLVEDSKDGGLEWDGRNNRGRAVDSGIYYFTVSSGKESIRGKFAVIAD
jgi:hypothetical protein